MKKIAIIAIAATAVMASCSGNKNVGSDITIQQQLENSLASASTFADSITAVDGTFIGGFFNAQLSNPQVGSNVSKASFIRGLRDALRCDTADMGYIYGFNSGAQALQTWVELNKNENVSRDAFINAIVAALQLDSISQEDLMQVRSEFEQFNQISAQRAQERARQEAINSEEGQANIAAAAEFTATLSASGDWTQVAPGVFRHVITPGTETALDPQERVKVSFAITALDGMEITSTPAPRVMYVSSPANPLLVRILPTMHMDEVAEYYLSYEEAFGAEGNPALGVGPCQSVLVKVTITPAE